LETPFFQFVCCIAILLGYAIGLNKANLEFKNTGLHKDEPTISNRRRIPRCSQQMSLSDDRDSIDNEDNIDSEDNIDTNDQQLQEKCNIRYKMTIASEGSISLFKPKSIHQTNVSIRYVSYIQLVSRSRVKEHQ
jgi:hypothetical protein